MDQRTTAWAFACALACNSGSDVVTSAVEGGDSASATRGSGSSTGASGTTQDAPTTQDAAGQQTTAGGPPEDTGSTGGEGSEGSGEEVPELSWQRLFGGSDYESASAIVLTDDDRILIAGHSRSGDIPGTSNAGKYDHYAVLVDRAGDIVWQTMWGDAGYNTTVDAIAAPGGGWLLAGVRGLGVDNDWLAVELQGTGAFGASFSLGGAESDWLVSATATDVGYFLVGSSRSKDFLDTPTLGQMDIVATAVDGVGNPYWVHRYGGISHDAAADAVAVSDGVVIASKVPTGTVPVEGHGWADIYVFKIDAGGEIAWQTMLGGSTWDKASAIAATPDDGVVVLGETQSIDIPGEELAGWSDYYVARLDSQGSLKWQRVIGGAYIDRAHDVQATSDGGAIVVGLSYSPELLGVSGDGNGDGVLLKLNAAGGVEWLRTYGGPSEEMFRSVRQLATGGYVAAGFASSAVAPGIAPAGKSDVYVVRTTADGLITE